MWNNLDNPPLDSIDILGQNDKWISEYNLYGIRIGFFSNGRFISAKYDNNHDTYMNEYEHPIKFMKIPIKYERIEAIFNKLFDHIKHGDEEHQFWLKEEMNRFLEQLIIE